MVAEVVGAKQMPKEKELVFRDKAGRIIGPRDLIVYAVSYGRSPGLSYGKVLEVTESKGSFSKKRVKLRVQGVDKPWGGVHTKKPGFLEYSERVLMVTRDQVPDEILIELDKIDV